MRALLVHNPSAGTKHHDKTSITAALALAEIEADYVSTKNTDIKRALKKRYDLVIAAGGDGTIANVFRYLTRRATPIAILPLGSANNIARSLGIAGTLPELAEQWRAGHVKPFHLLEVGYDDEETQLCAEGFGVGLMADLIERRAKGKKADGADDIRRGRRAFRAVLDLAPPLEIEVKLDGKAWDCDLLSIDALNIPFSGPALPLAHGADPGDKLLDVVAFETATREQLHEWIGNPLEESPPAIHRTVKKIELRWRRAASRLDSELVAAEPQWQRVRLRCDPKPLQIIVPVEHPAARKSAKGNRVKANPLP